MRESHATRLIKMNIYSLWKAPKRRLPVQPWGWAANLRNAPCLQPRPREVDHATPVCCAGVSASGLPGREGPGSIACPVVVCDGAPEVPAIVAVE